MSNAKRTFATIPTEEKKKKGSYLTVLIPEVILEDVETFILQSTNRICREIVVLNIINFNELMYLQ